MVNSSELLSETSYAEHFHCLLVVSVVSRSPELGVLHREAELKGHTLSPNYGTQLLQLRELRFLQGGCEPVVCEQACGDINSLNVWYNSLVKSSGPGLLFAWRFLVTD